MTKVLKSARILFVYHEFTYGGASKSLSFWLKVLAETGAHVTVVTYKSLKSPHHRIPQSVSVVGPSSGIGLPLIKRINDLFTVVKAAWNFRPDLIIGMMSVNSFYGYIAGRLLGAKVIVSERGCPTKEIGWLAPIKHWAMNRADGGVFQTIGAMSFYSDRLQSKSVIVPNPAVSAVGQVEFNNRSDQFLFVGRFELRQKRHDVLLGALRILIKKKPDVVVNFFGDGPDLDAVKQLAFKMGVSNNVKFSGVTSNISAILERHKYFIITSDYEGIPNTLIEAMLAGMACISTDCEPGGARELITNEKDGLLVDRGDIIALARAMERLLYEPHFAQTLGENARKISENFDEALIKEKIVSYISKFI